MSEHLDDPDDVTLGSADHSKLQDPARGLGLRASLRSQATLPQQGLGGCRHVRRPVLREKRLARDLVSVLPY